MKFTKMHSLGNDYIVINEYQGIKIDEDLKGEFSRKVCRRGFSVGADGVIFIQRAEDKNCDVKFRIFNSDGSEAEMCGNGIRCFSRYVYERVLKKNPLYVETLGGLRICEMDTEGDKVRSIRVYMGKPKFQLKDIPMVVEGKREEDVFLNEYLHLKNNILDRIKLSVVNVGNPHAVIFLEDNGIDMDFVRKNLEVLGREIENHEAFPERINVHFVETLGRDEIRMISWERGVGYTRACGTGATASAVVAHKLGKTGDKVVVHLDGGDLEVEIKENGAYLKGDAVLVYDGILREAL
ncbi:MAG TPA: diaminopimelate epimerase [Methanothermococcus okinawensis]|uniref:Diaminopimelate epimerase n=2 Tax=Methanothermococcus okinawensis TaxID=155863 RepID=A0A832ZSQ8_9EURY|nr:diaminopimelate epimerase [Methanothermococcus okinawensis]HIP91733.1 diaminopimelate epimerase [Methanothermococcus okinawensis]